MTKALLIVWLISGQGFALPFNSLADCLRAERGLDVSQVESSRCEFDQ